MADPTGFEPAISSVTGWHVGPLHHGSAAANVSSSRPLAESWGRPRAYPRSAHARPPIDLRSDTVTHPTPEMRRAMAEAEVGDDVFGDDPTVIALEERAAELTGKEAGAVRGQRHDGQPRVAHGPRAARRRDHRRGRRRTSSLDEAAGHAVVSRAHRSRRAVSDADGTMDLDAIRARHPRPERRARATSPSLVMLENTHAALDGPAAAGRLHRRGRPAWRTSSGVPLHVDGARLFNAAVALGTPAQELLATADQRHVLPVQGPGLPGRLGRGRRQGLHLAGAARAQAGRRRHAPGRRPRRARPDRAARRLRGHDRAPRRGPRQRPPAGRRASPELGHRRPGPGAGAHQLRALLE